MTISILYFAGKFHKVLFLAPGGKTVFQGTVPEAENYFEKLGFVKPERVNPADFYMDVIGGMCDSSQVDITSTSTSLPDQWEQYASQNNAGAARIEEAAGDSCDAVVRQGDMIEQLSFHTTTEDLIGSNENQGIMHLNWFMESLQQGAQKCDHF